MTESPAQPDASDAAASELTITRTGGIAGVHDVVQIEPDGSASVSQKTGDISACTPSPAAVDRVRAVDLSALGPAPSKTPIMDGFGYEIVGASGTASVGDGDTGLHGELLAAAAEVVSSVRGHPGRLGHVPVARCRCRGSRAPSSSLRRSWRPSSAAPSPAARSVAARSAGPTIRRGPRASGGASLASTKPAASSARPKASIPLLPGKLTTRMGVDGKGELISGNDVVAFAGEDLTVFGGMGGDGALVVCGLEEVHRAG